ncbi:hypothetical protein CA54_19120 [Symmachiella macrocystis]|uniref:ORC1/DEAH AAA+ ATPase domain-containing protein n=1 Tax=Symmachiella macrocystis TaxID=2527985 RepID=A0A5C6BP91_9PLAN|nr:AAA family ATPase [Symmachiella macrocystis]TWU13086.1 hypothetical protein CA54_19120 [Symmachiella macrocystis]
MYAQHWGLVDIPFQSTIDQRWFYEGPSHEEAVARLLFIVEQHRRLGVLVGEAGTGKSMLLAVLKRAVQRAQGQVVHVNVAGRSGEEVVWELAAGLRLSPRPDDPPRTLWRKIEEVLLGNQLAHVQTVLVFDHFEWADRECQKAIARLVHLNTQTPTWTTMVVAVREKALQESCDLFRHLIDLTIQAPPFSNDESRDYVISLLSRAGRRDPLFTDSALDRLHALSGGVPRELNRLCDMSLLAAMSAGAVAVTADIVGSFAAEESAEKSFDRQTVLNNV